MTGDRRPTGQPANRPTGQPANRPTGQPGSWDETVERRDEFEAWGRTPPVYRVSHGDHALFTGMPMRLLDRVARCRTPLFLVPGASHVPIEVTGPSRYASRVAACPLRFVLEDDLTLASSQLAFADGARLAGCLDLLRLPAQQLWVEWNDEVHQRVVYSRQFCARYDAAAAGRRVGVLLQASADGYSAIARTFWAAVEGEGSEEVTMSPLETHIDLRDQHRSGADMEGVLAGGFASLRDSADSAMTALLEHVRFKFDSDWAAYYKAAASHPDVRRQAVYGSLAAVARDIPMLLGFFLLLSAKDATRCIPVSRAVINRKRLARGFAPLLDHIEVRASLHAVQPDSDGTGIAARQAPRLHHVRGHLVRREDRVFWRSPHLRGSGVRGMVRSRTVCLSFAPRPGASKPAGLSAIQPR